MVAQCFPSQHSEAVRKSEVALGAPVQSVKPCVKKLSSIFFIVFLIIFFSISNQ